MCLQLLITRKQQYFWKEIKDLLNYDVILLMSQSWRCKEWTQNIGDRCPEYVNKNLSIYSYVKFRL